MDCTATLLYKGNVLTIDALVSSGRCRVQDFIDECSKSDQKKWLQLLTLLADRGYIGNQTKCSFFEHKGRSYLELKIWGKRIIGAYDKNRKGVLLLIYCFEKRGDRKLRVSEKESAHRMLELYYAGGKNE